MFFDFIARGVRARLNFVFFRFLPLAFTRGLSRCWMRRFDRTRRTSFFFSFFALDRGIDSNHSHLLFFFTSSSKQKGAKKVKSGTPSFYPADDIKKPLKSQAKSQAKNQTKLRKSITPGTVLIILAGHFKGKKCVFLKQLDSGLLLVCGPYGINGVPVKRLNQRYAIATSTKVDVSKVDCKAFDDKYFKKPAKDRSAKSEDGFFAAPTARKELPAEYVAANKALDASVGAAIGAVPHLKEYMSSLFSLKSGDKPHEMVF